MVTLAETTSERKSRRFPREGLGDLGVLAVQEQHIEIRTGGTANSDVTSQTVWSAAYINAAVLQDTYSSGTLQANSRLYFQQDANWDTTAIVEYDSSTSTWDIVQRYVYSPYGSITVLNADWSATPTGTIPDVLNLYQGMQYDRVTGLYYDHNRNYSPSLGTWTSQDPAGYINGANTYQFVMSNPVGRVDPSGYEVLTTGDGDLPGMDPWQQMIPGGGNGGDYMSYPENGGGELMMHDAKHSHQGGAARPWSDSDGMPMLNPKYGFPSNAPSPAKSHCPPSPKPSPTPKPAPSTKPPPTPLPNPWVFFPIIWR